MEKIREKDMVVNQIIVAWLVTLSFFLVACADTPPAITVPAAASATPEPAIPVTETATATFAATASASATAPATATASVTPAATPSVTATPAPVASPLPAPAGPVGAAIQDLAQRLNVNPEQVEVLAVVADEFPAGDLGCPSEEQPARPIPALVTGQRITLDVAGTTYRYHAHANQVVFCGIEG